MHTNTTEISMPGQNGDKPKRRKSKRRQETVVLCEACKHLFRALIVKPLTCSELYYFCIRCRWKAIFVV